MAANFRSDVYEGGLTVDPTVGPGVAATVGAILPRVGTTELWQKFGAGNTQWQLFTGGTTIFPPSRIAVVDPARGNDVTGAFGGSPYATITGALADAPGQTPTDANPCAIWIAPGSYTEAATVALVSNCHLSALPNTRGTVTITTQVDWDPGVGPNAPQIAAAENIEIGGIIFLSLINIDTTGKPGSSTILGLRDCSFGSLTIADRIGGNDSTLINDCDSSDTITVTNGDHLIKNSELGIVIAGNGDLGIAQVQIQACNVSEITVNNNSAVDCSQSNVENDVTVATGCTFLSHGGSVDTVVSAAGANVDIRNTEYGIAANLVGPGPIDRTITRFVAPASAIGANVVTFSALVPAVPPFLTADYNVILVPTAGSAPSIGVITAKGATSFTYSDTVANQIYDVTIIKE